MLSENMKGDFLETKELLSSTKERMNKVFDVSTSLLQFLSTHSDSWVLEDGEIKFQTEDLYNTYMGYISQISNQDTNNS